MLRTEPNLYTVVANFIFRCQTIHNRDLGTVEVLDFFSPLLIVDGPLIKKLI